MQNSGTQSNAGRTTSQEHRAPAGEQMGTHDTQSEFSVHEGRKAAAKEQNEQRQQQQQNADSKQQKPQEQRMSAQAEDTQSEFSVEQRLRDDQK